MKKNNSLGNKVTKKIPIKHFLFIMRTTFILLFICVFCSMAEMSYTQNARVTINKRNVTLREVLNEIESQTDYLFIYNNEVNTNEKVSVKAKQHAVSNVLNALLKNKSVSYSMEGNHIILSMIEKADDTEKEVVVASIQQQKKTITGNVVDEAGEPVIGANVVEVGTTNGTVTDVDGNFMFNVDINATIRITYIGYLEQDINSVGKASFTIVLQEDMQALDEVVVVGYGIQKKVNLTGAVSSIDIETETQSRPLTNLSTVLSGMSAGVQAFQSSGRPNSDQANIHIRGLGTLNNSAPLVLVDGVELSMNDVNPNDVESISILKDAASCAIYGNRGANGVILINTKQGVIGKTHVAYSGKFSYNQPSNLIDVVSNSANYFELINESASNIGQGNVYSQNTINEWRNAEKNPMDISSSGYPNFVAYPNTNWYNEVFQNKLMSEHSLSVVGASQKVKYNISGNFLDNPGLIDQTGLKKYFVRSNISVDLNDWLTLGSRIYGFHTDLDRSGVDAFVGGLGGQKISPDNYPYYDKKYGAPEAPESDLNAYNILYAINGSGGESESNRVNVDFFGDIKVLENFTLHTEFNYSRYWLQESWYDKQIGRWSFRENTLIAAPLTLEQMGNSLYFAGDRNWKFLQTLGWNKKLNIHELGTLIGYESNRYTGYNSDMSKRGAKDESLTDISTYSEMIYITGGTWKNAAQSFFGRLTYAYDSRYLFEVNARYDGSSRFSPDNRWGFFPSISAGWRINEEEFLKNSIFDNLKIRGSWGKLGNNSIGDYEWQATYSGSNYIFGDKLTNGLSQIVLANDRLQWESVTQKNIGLDIAIFLNRLSGTIDIYDKLTKGILYRPTIYASMGNKTPARQNFADVTNRGVELTLNWNGQLGKVKYGLSTNFSYNKNWVSKFKGDFKRGWTFDESGNQIYASNIGDISDGGDTRVIEGRMIHEYFLKEVYKGDGSYFFNNGAVNPIGGPKDGMIRTKNDMDWVLAMKDEGYTFLPNQNVGQSNLWYGDYVYADINGDGIYGNNYDRNFQNLSSMPKYYYGLQTHLSWYGIDFSMNWSGAAGFAIYWNTVGQNSTSTIIGYGISENIANDHYFYDPSNPDDPRTNLTSKNSRLTLNGTNQANEPSTLHLEKGNFVKLRNLTVGYTLSDRLMRKTPLSKVRFFLSGENLWTITKFSGMDPEMRTGMGYVTMRQLAFGVNVNF